MPKQSCRPLLSSCSVSCWDYGGGSTKTPNPGQPGTPFGLSSDGDGNIVPPVYPSATEVFLCHPFGTNASARGEGGHYPSCPCCHSHDSILSYCRAGSVTTPRPRRTCLASRAREAVVAFPGVAMLGLGVSDVVITHGLALNAVAAFSVCVGPRRGP